MHDVINNILIIKLKYLGDVLVTTPVFEALRYCYPRACISALVKKDTEEMLTQNPFLDNVFTLEKYANPVLDLVKYLQLIQRLRRLNLDIALELTNSDRGAILAFLSGAKRRLGFQSKKKKKLDRHLVFTDLITSQGARHIVDYHLEMVKYLGCTFPKKEISLCWGQEEERICKQILKDNGLSLKKKFVVLHPISQARYKAWHLDGYAAVCDYLQKECGTQTILVCNNNTDERRFVHRIMEISKTTPINLGGQLSLKQLAILISHAKLFIGIDSAPMHMATAVKTPVVAIFGPSRQFRWGPWGKGHIVIQKSWDCVPCGKEGCKGGGRSRCLDNLSIEEVIPIIGSKMNLVDSRKRL